MKHHLVQLAGPWGAWQPVAPQVLAGHLHLPPNPRGRGEAPRLKISQRQVHMLATSLDAGSDLLAPQHPLQLLEVQPVHLGPGPPSQALCRERQATVCHSAGPQMSPWLLHVHVGGDS